MAIEVPENEVRTKKVKVPRAKLQAFLDELMEDSNVVNIEFAPARSTVEVTVHYAIMDLAIQLGGVDCKIEKLADTLNEERYADV